MASSRLNKAIVSAPLFDTATSVPSGEHLTAPHELFHWYSDGSVVSDCNSRNCNGTSLDTSYATITLVASVTTYALRDPGEKQTCRGSEPSGSLATVTPSSLLPSREYQTTSSKPVSTTM